jgi:hypothetical protein
MDELGYLPIDTEAARLLLEVIAAVVSKYVFIDSQKAQPANLNSAVPLVMQPVVSFQGMDAGCRGDELKLAQQPLP